MTTQSLPLRRRSRKRHIDRNIPLLNAIADAGYTSLARFCRENDFSYTALRGASTRQSSPLPLHAIRLARILGRDATELGLLDLPDSPHPSGATGTRTGEASR